MNRWKYVLVGLLVGAFAFPLVWNSDPSVIGQTVTVDSTQSPLVVNAAADLADLTPTDGQSVIIKTGTEKGLWYYDKDSSTATSVSVLNGPGSVGRFLVINNDAGSVAAATAITAAEITDDGLLELQAFDGSSAKSLTLEELKKTGVQVINVMQYGATVNGVADDTAEIQAALTAAGDDYAVVIDGPCFVSDTLTIPAGGTLIGAGPTAKLIVANLWANKPVLSLANNGSSVIGLDVEETSASAIDAAKSGDGNIAISITGDDCLVEDCDTTGFMFGVTARSSDRAKIIECDTTLAKAWGIEVDVAIDVQVVGCTSHENGWHGMKVQNDSDAQPCNGLVVDRYLAYDNGQRTVPAGGSESENGAGISFYDGGFRYTLSNSVCHGNYGPGFSQKGGGADPTQGEGVITNCQFVSNITGAGVAHGMEFGVGSGLGAYNIHVSNVNASGNTGDGFSVQGGIGITFSACTANNNTNNGATTYWAFDTTFSQCNFLSNGVMGMRIGYDQTTPGYNKRIAIRDCTVSGNWDDSLTLDPATAATTKETDYGILVYADTVGTVIDNVKVLNIAGNQQSLMAYGNKTTIRNTQVRNGVRNGIYVGGTEILIDNCDVIDTNFATSVDYGAYYVAASASCRIENSKSTNASGTANNKLIRAEGTAYTRNTSYTNIAIPHSIGAGAIICDLTGTGSPEATIVASVGSKWTQTDGGTETLLYVKESGAGNTGWVAVASTITLVEASTAGSGAPNVLLGTESSKALTNEGTTAVNYHTLPTAVAGLTYTFVVQDADGLRITTASGDTIRLGPNVTATAGYIESTTIGDIVTVTAINATEWVGHAYGTWTNGTWSYALADTP